MIPEQIAELRALLAKATPGPWWSVHENHAALISAGIHAKGAKDIRLFTSTEATKQIRASANDDTDLACAAVNALPELLDAIDRLRATVASAEFANAEARRRVEIYQLRADELRAENARLTDERDAAVAGVASALEAMKAAKQEIEYWHADYLTERERSHPRGSGWARVFDQLTAAEQALATTPEQNPEALRAKIRAECEAEIQAAISGALAEHEAARDAEIAALRARVSELERLGAAVVSEFNAQAARLRAGGGKD